MEKVIPGDAVLVPDGAIRVFSGEIFDVYQWPQEMYDGSQATFEMLKRPDTVNVVCVVDGGILVLTDEQPNRGAVVTLPGGRVDSEDASTLAAAQRETAEETGYHFINWKLLHVQQPYRKIEWFVYLYVAWGVSNKVSSIMDPGEKISLKITPLTDALEQFRDKSGDAPELLDILGLDRQLLTPEGLTELSEFEGVLVDR